MHVYSTVFIRNDLIRNIAATFRCLIQTFSYNYRFFITDSPIYTEITVVRHCTAIINSYLSSTKYLSTLEISNEEEIERLYLVLSKHMNNYSILLAEKVSNDLTPFLDFYLSKPYSFVLNNFNELFLDNESHAKIFDNALKACISFRRTLIPKDSEIKMIVTKSAIFNLFVNHQITVLTCAVELSNDEVSQYVSNIIFVLENNTNIQIRLLSNERSCEANAFAPVDQYITKDLAIIFDNEVIGNKNFLSITDKQFLVPVNESFDILWNNEKNFSTKTNSDFITILKTYLLSQ